MKHIIFSNVMKYLDQHNVMLITNAVSEREDPVNPYICPKVWMKVHRLKAFDKLSHIKITVKLDYYGIYSQKDSGLSHQADLDSYYGGEKSQSGVQQGTELGSVLFLVYINELPGGLRVTHCLFADDYLLYLTNESHEGGMYTCIYLPWGQ